MMTGRVDGGGGFHDRQRLLHVVDVERRHTVIVLRRVVEQLTQGNASHLSKSPVLRRSWRSLILD